jgi:hypothetical protein
MLNGWRHVVGLYWRNKCSIADGVGGGEIFVRIGELEGVYMLMASVLRHHPVSTF